MYHEELVNEINGPSGVDLLSAQSVTHDINSCNFFNLVSFKISNKT